MKKSVLVLIASALLCGCVRSQIAAPGGAGKYTLATKTDICQEADSHTVVSLWYLINYNNNSSVPTLREVSSDKKVRFRTKVTFMDGIFTMITGGLLSCHTIVTETCQ